MGNHVALHNHKPLFYGSGFLNCFTRRNGKVVSLGLKQNVNSFLMGDPCKHLQVWGSDQSGALL